MSSYDILIHEGHLGLNKIKLRAKDTVYWPGLNEQLEKLVLNCELSLSIHFPSASRDQVTVHPWTKLVTDILHFECSSYL